ncbi:MAG: TetR/AcrR family transcriptional regulator [Myxococcota bacterium]
MSGRRRESSTPEAAPKGKRRGGSGDKRERILSAAIRVFAKNGFYSTRVSEIAKAAGVADGTIYLYFENKDHVLISIFEDRIGQLIEVMREVASAADDPRERIRRIIALQLGQVEANRDLAEVVTVNLRQSSTLLKQYATPLFLKYLEVIAGVIADGQARGMFRDDVSPRLAARSLYGGVDGIMLTWALGEPEPSALRKAAQQYTELFLRGLSPEPPAEVE